MNTASLPTGKDTPCLKRIEYYYDMLSKVSKKVADYILSNPEAAIYMTVLQLAETCGVSEASVVRFCKSIGYTGFNEMKISLASESDLGTRVIMEDMSPSDTEAMILEKVFSKEKGEWTVYAHSVLNEQIKNRLAVCMAALYLMSRN